MLVAKIAFLGLGANYKSLEKASFILDLRKK